MAGPNKHYSVCNIQIPECGNGAMRIMDATVDRYREAFTMICKIVESEQAAIFSLATQQERKTYVEHLIHTTHGNKAKYPEFDLRFYKFPSYLRRALIMDAIEAVGTYRTNTTKYQIERKAAIDAGHKFQKKAPTLQYEAKVWPVLYDKQSYELIGDSVRLKVWIRNTWDWITVPLSKEDLRYLRKKLAQGCTLKSPRLVYRYNSYYLQMPLVYPSATWDTVPLDEQKILAVDLGVNRGATVCVMDASGTILGRAFDPFNSERDHLGHLINKRRKIQRQSGRGNSTASIDTKIRGVKEDYSNKLAHWITNVAMSYGVYGVVFEYLHFTGRTYNARIHHWCKRHIQDLVKGMCNRNGIHVYHINPKDTSALAYDGSGATTRGEYVSAGGAKKYNYSVCTFSTGKQYNCDLNASYNIGARYFIREYQKTMSANLWSQATAKVPGLAKRTTCTLATLRALREGNFTGPPQADAAA